MTTTRAKAARAAKQTAGEKIASQIVNGDLDAEIHTVLNAVMRRVMTGAVTTNWRLDIGDLSASEEDLTLDEAALLEEILAPATWKEIDPLKSAHDAKALIGVLYRTRLGLTLEQAAERMKPLTVKQVMDAMSRTSEVNPPKD